MKTKIEQIFVFNQEYANSTGAKIWDGKDSVRFFLIALLIEIVLLFPIIVLSASIKYLGWIVMLLYYESWVGISVLTAHLISIKQDVWKSAYIIYDNHLWFVKLIYLNNHLPASYIEGFMEAVKGKRFVETGRQIIHHGSNSSVEILRMDAAIICKTGKDYRIISYYDYKGKIRKRKVLDVFPGLFDYIECMSKDLNVSERFPKTVRRTADNYIVPGIAVLILVMTILWSVPNELRNYRLDHTDYKKYISEDMLNEALENSEFLMDRYYIDERDGYLDIKIYGFDKTDDYNLLIWFTSEPDRLYFTQSESNPNWHYYAVINE